jgi:integrase/recombinase XerD
MCFEDFIREKRYLTNVTPTTLKYYGYVFARWNDYIGKGIDPTEQNLKEFVIRIRESGVSPFTCNSYIRGFNSYLTWRGNGLKIKKIKEPEPVLVLFTNQQMKALTSTKGQKFHERRLHALICLLADTGMRIDEALNLKKADVDFDNLLVTVTAGKGRKGRIIPISRECRKVLYLFKHDHAYWFPVTSGSRWAYESALGQFKRLCKRLGVNGARCSFHTIRHWFAVSYIRAGGDLFRLSRLLGHSDIKTTEGYLRHGGLETIREAHAQFSPLSRL